jgi:adenosine deaminase
MFGTTLTDEYLRISETFGFDAAQIKQLVMNGVQASLLPADRKYALEKEFRTQFTELENEIDR